MKLFLFFLSLLFTLFIPHLSAQNDLEYYINTAKKNSPLINDNQNQSEANRLEAERLKAFYTKPQIGITAAYLFSPIISQDNNTTRFQPNSQAADKYIGYDFAAANAGQYQALLNINQPVFNGKRYETSAEQLNIASQVNQNNVNLTGHDIEKIITDQYVLCLQDSKLADYAQTMVTLLEEQKVVVSKLAEAGIYKQSDFTLLNIEYRNFTAQLTTYIASYRRDLLDMNILCGINDTARVALKNMDLQLNGNQNQNGFTEKYKLDSLNLVSSQKIFELRYKPQLNVFANTGLNAVYAGTIPSRFGLSAGLNFTYNFFDGHQKNINQKKTDVLLKTVSFYRNNFVNQNTVRKTKIMNELQSYNDRIAIAEQQLSDYQTLLSSYKNEILSGQLSIISYSNILKNLATTQRDYLLLFSQKQTLINAYNYWNW